LAVATALFLALVGLAMAAYMVSLSASTDLQPDVSQARLVTSETRKGIIDKPSHHAVDLTVETLKSILQSKGVTLFTVGDHSGEAQRSA
jgi:hypothetical protein